MLRRLSTILASLTKRASDPPVRVGWNGRPLGDLPQGLPGPDEHTPHPSSTTVTLSWGTIRDRRGDEFEEMAGSEDVASEPSSTSTITIPPDKWELIRAASTPTVIMPRDSWERIRAAEPYPK